MTMFLNLVTDGHEDNGIFWISYPDFLRYFGTIDICKIHKTPWSEVRLEGSLPPLASSRHQVT